MSKGFPCAYWQVYSFPRAIVLKYHKQDGLKQHIVSWGQKSKIKMAVGLCFETLVESFLVSSCFIWRLLIFSVPYLTAAPLHFHLPSDDLMNPFGVISLGWEVLAHISVQNLGDLYVSPFWALCKCTPISDLQAWNSSDGIKPTLDNISTILYLTYKRTSIDPLLCIYNDSRTGDESQSMYYPSRDTCSNLDQSHTGTSARYQVFRYLGCFFFLPPYCIPGLWPSGIKPVCLNLIAQPGCLLSVPYPLFM